MINNIKFIYLYCSINLIRENIMISKELFIETIETIQGQLMFDRHFAETISGCFAGGFKLGDYNNSAIKANIKLLQHWFPRDEDGFCEIEHYCFDLNFGNTGEGNEVITAEDLYDNLTKKQPVSGKGCVSCYPIPGVEYVITPTWSVGEEKIKTPVLSKHQYLFDFERFLNESREYGTKLIWHPSYQIYGEVNYSLFHKGAKLFMVEKFESGINGLDPLDFLISNMLNYAIQTKFHAIMNEA